MSFRGLQNIMRNEDAQYSLRRGGLMLPNKQRINLEPLITNDIPYRLINMVWFQTRLNIWMPSSQGKQNKTPGNNNKQNKKHKSNKMESINFSLTYPPT
jgi:hypothetical protein